MKAILQRVSHAQVDVEEKTVGSIGKGFLILLGVENGDDRIEADVLAAKISGLRIFTGSVLVISNFTLCADCSHGRRPNFINAARPENAEPLYEYFCQKLLDNGVARVEKGIFGADMKVSLLNDGPVTIDINSKDLKR